MFKLLSFILALLMITSCSNNAQNSITEKDKMTTQIDSIVAQMTLEEKVGMLHGIICCNTSLGIQRQQLSQQIESIAIQKGLLR